MGRRKWIPAHDGYPGHYIEISDQQARNEDDGGELGGDGVWRPYTYDAVGRPKPTGRWKNGAWVPYRKNDSICD